jgi:hypothetical protein
MKLTILVKGRDVRFAAAGHWSLEDAAANWDLDGLEGAFLEESFVVEAAFAADSAGAGWALGPGWHLKRVVLETRAMSWDDEGWAFLQVGNLPRGRKATAWSELNELRRGLDWMAKVYAKDQLDPEGQELSHDSRGDLERQMRFKRSLIDGEKIRRDADIARIYAEKHGPGHWWGYVRVGQEAPEHARDGASFRDVVAQLLQSGPVARGRTVQTPDGPGLVVSVRSCGSGAGVHVSAMGSLDRGALTPSGYKHVGGGVVWYPTAVLA